MVVEGFVPALMTNRGMEVEKVGLILPRRRLLSRIPSPNLGANSIKAGEVAQSAEQGIHKPLVIGSSPILATYEIFGF